MDEDPFVPVVLAKKEWFRIVQDYEYHPLGRPVAVKSAEHPDLNKEDLSSLLEMSSLVRKMKGGTGIKDWKNEPGAYGASKWEEMAIDEGDRYRFSEGRF
ncbi:MAG: hypothetical protein ACQKBT_00215 [Puniceicoccales bacterium]